MKENKIIVAGIGPGSPEDITPAVVNALKESDVVIGYKYYFQFTQVSDLEFKPFEHTL